MSKRILMVIDGLPGGGAEKVVLTLAKGFLDQGHRVSLFSLRSVCDYAIPSGLDYQVVKDNCTLPWRKLTELRRRARQLDHTIAAAERLNGAFDLVVSHLHKTDRIVRRSKQLIAHKTWYCLHGVFSASYLAHRQGFSLWLKRKKIQHVYQHRNLIGVSQYVLDDLKRYYQVEPAREQVIFNPFDIDEIRQLAQAPCDMAGSDYLLHVGRIHEAKRHDRLIRAYALSGLTVPLVLIGQGSPSQIAALKQLAQELHVADRILFKGFTQNPYSWIAHARMLIVSSDSEGFGNVLVEALICQTSVVCTRCPGGPEAILQGDLARGLAEMDDVSLAEKINEIYHNPLNLNDINLNEYGISTICQRYLALADSN